MWAIWHWMECQKFHTHISRELVCEWGSSTCILANQSFEYSVCLGMFMHLSETSMIWVTSSFIKTKKKHYCEHWEMLRQAELFFVSSLFCTLVNSSACASTSWTALTRRNRKGERWQRQKESACLSSGTKTGPAAAAADAASGLLRRPGAHGRTRSAEVSIGNQICSIFTFCRIHYRRQTV